MRTACVAAVILAVSSVATAQEVRDPLATQSGWEAGAQTSYYKYTEPYFPTPPISPKTSGARLGVVATGTYTGTGLAFAKLDLRASYGSLEYTDSVSTTITGVPDYILEARGLVGADFIGANASLSPYLGFGYRYLFNDLRAYNSTGGYRRYSNYLYIPLGLTARFPLGDGWIVIPTVEGDVFLQGRQVSDLSDSGIPGYVDVTNRQDSGRGYRVALMLEKHRWAFGAWTHYWHIDTSDTQFAGVVNGKTMVGSEPENFTREYGVELRYRF